MIMHFVVVTTFISAFLFGTAWTYDAGPLPLLQNAAICIVPWLLSFHEIQNTVCSFPMFMPSQPNPSGDVCMLATCCSNWNTNTGATVTISSGAIPCSSVICPNTCRIAAASVYNCQQT